MIAKNNLGWGGICLYAFALAYTIALFLFTTCMSVDEDFLQTKLTVIGDNQTLFENAGGSRTFEIESNRDWSVKVESGAEWIAVSPMKGSEETKELTVTVKKNEGESRKGSVKVTCSSIDKTITISQKGKDAPTLEYTTIRDIRDMYEACENSELIIDEHLLLKAVVISDRLGANRSAKRDGFIQDESGDGLAFRVTQNETPFDMGDELIINLKDAKIHYFDYAGIVQIIFSKMDVEVIDQSVFVAPIELTIDEIENGAYDGTLVKIKDVQFREYEHLKYYDSGNATNRLLECVDGCVIDVKTTKNANFRNEALPAGSGCIVGIASFCKKSWELQVRNLDDVKGMSNDVSTRFVEEEPPIVESKITIADLRAKLKDGKTYTEESYIEGEVILNAFKRNVPDNVVYLADETAGISLLFSDKDSVLTNVPFGAKIKVKLKGLKAKELNGLLQIGDENTLSTLAVEIVEEKSSNPLQPKVATVDEVLSGKYQAQLVIIDNVQFKSVDERYVDSPFVVDKSGNELQVYTREEAYFAGQRIKKEMGAIVAVVSVNNIPQLLLRSLNDLAEMKGDRFDTSPSFITTSKDIIAFVEKGGKESIAINSNVKWEVLNDIPWLSIAPTNGVNDGEIVVTANENEGDDREASFKVISSSLNKTITITQKGKEATVLEYITIKDIRDMYEVCESSELIIDEPLILKAVVISDRVGANRSAKRDGFIQDKAGDGIAFRVTQSETPFDMGDELDINLKDAKIHYFDYAGIVQIIFSKMDAEIVRQNVFVAPKELTITDIQNRRYDGTLVKIKDVQFKEYKGLNYYAGSGNSTSRILENSNGATIHVNTTKNASFRNNALPSGSGNIVGIASFCKKNWELQVRNLGDVKGMSNDVSTRFVEKEPPVIESKITIADLRAKLKDGKIYTGENYIEAEVILNAFKGNVADNVVYLADETAGIALTFSDTENVLTNVPIGAKVKMQLKGVKAKKINGLLQIGGDNTLTTHSVAIIEEKPSKPFLPKAATIEEILLGKYQSELVKIEKVQFKEIGIRYADRPFIISHDYKEAQVYTREKAVFANDIVKEGMGAIVAVASVNNMSQLLIRSIDDLADMTNNRFDTSPPFITPSKDKVAFQGKGGTENITISSNVNWEVLSDDAWLSITPLSGMNDGEITVTVNENEGEDRKTTITITNGGIIKTIEVVQEGVKRNDDLCKDLFFSEYIEGSSFNKYLEIYNGTGKAVDLSDYIVETYMNGQSEPKYTESLFGLLKSGDVLVLENSRSYLYYEENSIVSTVTTFNGNDAIALVKIADNSYTYIDIIGCIGENPGKEWVDPNDKELSTLDRTLVRKPSVRGGVTKNPKEGFPTLGTEWISYPIDTIDYLGSHTID